MRAVQLTKPLIEGHSDQQCDQSSMKFPGFIGVMAQVCVHRINMYILLSVLQYGLNLDLDML